MSVGQMLDLSQPLGREHGAEPGDWAGLGWVGAEGVENRTLGDLRGPRCSFASLYEANCTLAARRESSVRFSTVPEASSSWSPP